MDKKIIDTDLQSDRNPATAPENAGRRKAFKTLVGGVSALAAYHVVPERWSRPIIEQVILPANAQTSGVSLNDPCSLSVISGNTLTSSVVVRVEGFVTPPTSGLAVTISASPSGAGSPATDSATTDASGDFSADITINDGPGITSVSVTTSVAGAAAPATCSVMVPVATTTPIPTSTT